MYDRTISDPMSGARELEDVVQCKGCDEWVSVGDNRCTCNVQCCESCGSACVLRSPERLCTACDASVIAACDKEAREDDEALRRVLKLHAGTHPAFDGTWIGRVTTCEFDGCVAHEVEEVTERIEPESMAKTVAR